MKMSLVTRAAFILAGAITLGAVASAQSVADRFRECRNGQGQKAIDACTWYLKAGLNPSAQDRVFALVARGYAEFNLKSYDDALADFSSALEVEPKNIYARLDHSAVLEMRGQYDLAIADLDVVIEQDPTNARYANDRCYLRAEWGQDLDKALADCDAALKIDPKHYQTQDSLCFVHYRMGMFAEAIANCSAALAANPDLAPSLYVRGLAESRLGQVAASRADIDRAEIDQPGIDAEFASYAVKP